MLNGESSERIQFARTPMTTHDDALHNLLETVFAAARPEGGLEDRVIAQFRDRAGRQAMVLHPVVRRAAVGVAAAILLGGVGFVVTREETIQGKRLANASNLKQMGLSVQVY